MVVDVRVREMRVRLRMEYVAESVGGKEMREA